MPTSTRNPYTAISRVQCAVQRMSVPCGGRASTPDAAARHLRESSRRGEIHRCGHQHTCAGSSLLMVGFVGECMKKPDQVAQRAWTRWQCAQSAHDDHGMRPSSAARDLSEHQLHPAQCSRSSLAALDLLLCEENMLSHHGVIFGQHELVRCVFLVFRCRVEEASPGLAHELDDCSRELLLGHSDLRDTRSSWRALQSGTTVV
mmetsp:Transcript_24984/g.77845  ORF Transcript_24984/g.77845 Transcript_24984/m.77845 type:complete len:203 (+) Transcript_24984:348-956(+)